MLAYVRPMLAYVGLGWPMLGLCWPHVPMLSHPGGYVGHMLGICWLSWAYVEDMLGNLSRLEGLYPRNVDYACPPGAHYRHHP